MCINERECCAGALCIMIQPHTLLQFFFKESLAGSRSSLEKKSFMLRDGKDYSALFCCFLLF